MTTVAEVLFDGTDPAQALTAAPAWGPVLTSLDGLAAVSGGGRAQVERELAAAVAGLLGLDLSDVLMAAWRQHRALRAAALATRDSPATEFVKLATHRISTTHRPAVEVAVNGLRLATVTFELSLTMEVDGLLATIRQARLVDLRDGRCAVIASLGWSGQALASARKVLDPRLTVPLGTGVELL